MVIITVENLQKRIRLNPQRFINNLKKALRQEGILSVHLSVVFITDPKIRQLHKTYLKKDSATDVLTFNFGPDLKQKKKGFLNGEIFISIDTAIRNAKTHQTSLVYEVTLYAVHGILHLLGYDDHSPKDIREIRAKEDELMKLIKL